MGVVLILHQHAAARERLRRAASMAAASGARHELRYACEWSGIPSGVGLPGVACVVVDTYLKGPFAITEVTNIVRRDPHLPLIVYSDFRQRPAADVVALSRLGVEHILTLEVDDDPDRIRELIANATASPIWGMLYEALSHRLTERAVRIVQAAFRLTEDRNLGNADLARQFDIHPRVLERSCVSLSLPTPARIVQWCRMLRAAALLADSARTSANIADLMGFPDESTFRRTVKRLTGCTPRALRGPAAVPTVLAMIVEEFAP
jgi:AraC-like DNA-binding protein